MDINPVEKCYICLSHFEKQTVASLENCQHVFCLACIVQWSQASNTCPVDRISFSFIHQRRCPGGAIQKKIKVETPRKDADEEEEEEATGAVFCEECGRSDRRHRLLVCTQCDSGYHMNCLTPPLNTGPEGDYWTCPECAVTPHHTDPSVLEEEISDGELTDLLAEVDEPPSTSSRLRRSTVDRPRSGSPERRRSARVQTRTSNNEPRPRPHTHWHVPKYLLKASRPPVTSAAAPPPQHSDSSSSTVELNTGKRKRV